MVRVVGVRPRPRMLVLGVPAGDEYEGFRQAIRDFAPTVRFVDPTELSQLRQREWDMIVVFFDAPTVRIAPHLFIIQFGGSSGFVIPGQLTSVLAADYITSATEFHVPDDLPAPIASLVSSSLLPAVQESTDGNQYLHSAYVLGGVRTTTPFLYPPVEPFLMDGDGKPLAGIYKRSESVQYWWIPFKGNSILNWIAVAIDTWRTVAPDAFPSAPGWRSSETWQTSEERALQEEVNRLVDKRVKLVRQSEARELTLRGQLATAGSAADRAERRLLTAQGDDLVDEVAASLEEIGFAVSKPDLEEVRKGDRLEDLQIRDPADPDWIALAEVRGYKGGAQVNDLLRISRFVSRFVAAEKRLPDRTWYIVNQFFAQDPRTRPRPLKSNPAELEEFSEGGGLVIDTRDLFQTRMKVREGSLSTANAVKVLKAQTGDFLMSFDEASQS